MGLAEQLEKQLVGGGPLPARGGACFRRHQLEVARRIGAKMWIDVMEGAAVVFVKRAGVKDGIEINGVDSQLGQVVELVDHTLQVATVAAIEDTVFEKVRAAL